MIVAGSRDAPAEAVEAAWEGMLRRGTPKPITTILSGGASGADRAGEAIAAREGIRLELHPADWQAHGKSAGPIRNAAMVEAADGLLLVWSGSSRGSADVLRQAQRRGLWVSQWIYALKQRRVRYAGDTCVTPAQSPPAP